MGLDGRFKDNFERNAQSDAAALHSLHMIFAYVVDHQHRIDNALVPSLDDLEVIHQNLDQNGLESLNAQDGETILHMVSGLQCLKAEAVPGYYEKADFERATVLAERLIQKAMP